MERLRGRLGLGLGGKREGRVVGLGDGRVVRNELEERRKET